jgi:hypothetical protein
MPNPDRAYDPKSVVEMVQEYLEGWFGPVDVEQPDTAYIAAATLLRALGVDPKVDVTDKSPGAALVRETMLEDSTRTTTRSRRSL